MRTILFSTLLILSSNFIASQRMSNAISMQWQDMIWDVPGDPTLINAFESTEGFIVFKKHANRGPRGYRYYIETLDENLRRTDIKDISDAIDKGNFYDLEIYQFAGKLFIITSFDYRELSKQEFYLQEVDWVNGTVGSRQVVYEYNYTGRRSDLSVHKRISPNGDYFLLSFAQRVAQRRLTGRQIEADRRSFVVFNSEMEVVERQDNITIEYAGDQYDIIQTIVSDKGAIYLLADRIFEARGEEPVKSILKFQDGELVANKINFKEGKLLDMLISMNPDGTLYCGGYYSEDIGRGSGQGVVVMNVDSDTGEPINISTQLIGIDLLVEGLSDREKNRLNKRQDAGKDVKQTRNITIRDVVPHKDGTSSLIGEIFYIVTTTTSGANGMSVTTTTYHYNELFVTRISKNGEIIKTVKMPKKYGAMDLKTSFHAFDLDNELAIVFYDNRNNLIEIGPKGVLPYTRKSKTSALSIVTIDELGNQKREGLIDYAIKPFKSYRHYYMWRDLVVFGNNRMLFMTYYGRKQFGYMLATPR